MGYIIYRNELGGQDNRNPSLPEECHLEVWKPSVTHIWPQGIKEIRIRLEFFVVWLLYFVLKYPSKDGYRVFVIYHKGKPIHRTVFTTKSFKYPFMPENDIQVGMIFTEVEFRRKGLAAHTISEILKRYEIPGRASWYITEEDNAASRKLAEKSGFSEYSKARRKRLLGLGRYQVAQKTGNTLSKKIPDYSLITESAGIRATREQVARLYERYHFAREFSIDKDVLEIGCGSGLGLGYLAKVAKKVVGGDIEGKNVAAAREYYRNRENVIVNVLDAQNTLLSDKSFDLALLYETIYYLKDPRKCFSEVGRVLRQTGTFILCTVNKDWEDFHPSPYTHRYFSVPELYELMKKDFREVKLYGGFPVLKGGAKSKVTSVLKRSAVKFKLIPGSLKARAHLKRIFMGKLFSLPAEVYEGMAPYDPPVEIRGDKINRDFKIIYAIGVK